MSTPAASSNPKRGKKKFGGKIDRLETTIETPNGRGRLTLLNVEWSSDSKESAEHIGKLLRKTLGVPEEGKEK